MTDEMVQSLLEIDSLELPLCIETDTIEKIGRIIDDLRARKAPPRPDASSSEAGSLALAQAIYRLRRVRDEDFGAKLFADPSWDMLLDLFIAAERNTKVSISSACIASSSPATTALRHLSAMAKNGLVTRESSGEDGRVAWVTLTPTAYDKVATVLRSWSS